MNKIAIKQNHNFISYFFISLLKGYKTAFDVSVNQYNKTYFQLYKNNLLVSVMLIILFFYSNVV